MPLAHCTSYSLGFIPIENNLKIFYRVYKAKEYKAGLLLVHGFAEHSGRYQHLISELNAIGISTFSLDLRGHGYSQGKRGLIYSFNDYINDMTLAFEEAKSIFGQEKLFILAHSMGGLVASIFAAENSSMIKGLILSSPAFGMNMEISWWKSLAGKLMSNVLPGFSLPSTIAPEHLTQDESMLEQYKKDPLIFRHVTARLYTEVLNSYETARKNIFKIGVPVLFQVSGNDLVVNSEKSQEFFNLIKVKDKTIKLYDGFLHEIYNEKERQEPIDDLLGWLTDRVNKR